MTENPQRRGFASRPGDADKWIKASEGAAAKPPPPVNEYAARLTLDVTTDMRARIKIAAFQNGQTVADMLRALFEREFPNDVGDER